PSRYISLSLIHPSDEDREQLKRGGSTYTVITRKGKRENNSYTGTGDFRAEKDKVFMLKEGSVFDFKIKGSAPVVYPTNEEGYEIKDFGYSFLIGF
ncbi:MAG: hypothetical protein N3A62_04975, partial [Thermodesulfovibrionales bacterium]|nr:hypothetical protein [Thermodesulfovibrionales bacterium]